ncbi:hypothetical protein GF371_00590 [Candidatus Woesearchaeota archaeon]|nr:hypothetical protein [Candidatus Woesearchaeota archaeon]
MDNHKIIIGVLVIISALFLINGCVEEKKIPIQNEMAFQTDEIPVDEVAPPINRSILGNPAIVYCESDDDCTIIEAAYSEDSRSSPCAHGCASRAYIDELNQMYMYKSSCSPMYDCRCENNTCIYSTFQHYVDAAIEEKDPSVCEKAIGHENICYKKVAISLNDSEVCEEIDDYLKSECLAVINKDENFCNEIKDLRRINCLHEIAVLKENPSICEEIPWENRKGSLGDSCFYDLAMLKNDAELCKKVLFDPDRTMCLAIVNQDSSLCKDLPYDWMKEDCLKEA